MTRHCPRPEHAKAARGFRSAAHFFEELEARILLSDLTLLNSFDGASGVNPPDSMGAVGPDYLVELINYNYSVYDKTGGITGRVGAPVPNNSTYNFVNNISPNAFWTAAGISNPDTVGDQRILFDPVSNRWFASGLGHLSSPPGPYTIDLAISADSDPTHGWKGFTFSPSTTATNESDQPRLAVDANGVYIIDQRMNGTLSREPLVGINTIYTFPKSDLVWGGTGQPGAPSSSHMQSFSVSVSTGGWDQLIPVTDFSASKGPTDPETIVRRTGAGSSNAIRTYGIAWSGTTASFNSATYSDSSLGNSYYYPLNSAEPGGYFLYSSYGQIIDAVQVNGSVYTVYGARIGSHNGVQWAQVNLSDHSLTQFTPNPRPPPSPATAPENQISYQ